jgi:hypothetical protein
MHSKRPWRMRRNENGWRMRPKRELKKKIDLYIFLTL